MAAVMGAPSRSQAHDAIDAPPLGELSAKLTEGDFDYGTQAAPSVSMLPIDPPPPRGEDLGAPKQKRRSSLKPERRSYARLCGSLVYSAAIERLFAQHVTTDEAQAMAEALARVSKAARAD